MEHDHVSLLTPAELASLKNSSPTDIMSALQDLESRLMKRLAFNPEQANIADRFHVLALVKKLKDFSLSADEWSEFKEFKKAGLGSRRFSSSEMLAPFCEILFLRLGPQQRTRGEFHFRAAGKTNVIGRVDCGRLPFCEHQTLVGKKWVPHVVDLTPHHEQRRSSICKSLSECILGSSGNHRLVVSSPRCAAFKIEFARPGSLGLF